MGTKTKTGRKIKRTFDARPDTLDFRDKMYVPTLVEVPTHVSLDTYRAWKIPVLDQGTEGACTGYGLATVVNYLLTVRKVEPDCTPVSARMLYELAKRYDEWPGEDYAGSSARGAMKGWHKHGVCAERFWESKPTKSHKSQFQGLNEARTRDALRRPLGAYYRVNHKDIVALHSAIAEVGILYATADVHEGWERVSEDGIIEQSDKILGGHAFAIVAYDSGGFWIQNSWGTRWGKDGFARVSYDDWLANGSDVWVARLGAPIELVRGTSTATAHAASSGLSIAYSYHDLRPHIISIGNDGTLKASGNYGTSAREIQHLFAEEIPGAIGPKGQAKYQHLLLYAHGGLVSEESAVQRLADYRATMLSAGIYPLTFIWHSDFWSTLENILSDALRKRRPEGMLDAAKDFMLDRLDDALEPLARPLGKAAWDEMKENAIAATQRSAGAGRQIVKHLAKMQASLPNGPLKLHLVSHSAGSIFQAPLVTALVDAGLKIETCTLWAPACTTALFKEHYLSALMRNKIKRLTLFVLSDQVERDDHCAHIYNKSLLYLVAHAFEAVARIPKLRDRGESILGLEKCVHADPELQRLFRSSRAELVVAPNTRPLDSPDASTATNHGSFDDDKATVRATLRRILGVSRRSTENLDFHRSAASLRDRRRALG
jgi:hypothetical protein